MNSAPTRVAHDSSARITAQYDLHCHVLPAWDDGPKTLEESLQLVQRAASCGTKLIFATPHVGRKFGGVKHPSATIAPAVAQFQKEVDARGLGVKILPGAEILMGAVDISMGAPLKDSWTYGNAGHYLLIESPNRAWPVYGNHVVQEVLRHGVTAILAHPERYVDVQRNPKILDQMLHQGALVQITAGALVGDMGKESMKCAFHLLETGMVHIISSDAHTPQHTMAGEVVELVCQRIGEARARQIFVDNPAAVVAGKAIPAQISPTVAPTSFLKKLFSKGV